MTATDLLLDLQQASSHPEHCPAPTDFERWVRIALPEQLLQQGVELTIRLVDEAESHELNLTYRHKDKPTNVLSFPFEAPIDLSAEGELTLLGDLVICVPLVQQEAAVQQKPLQHHWAHLVIHGTLHLLGYDHITDEEATEMEGLETRLLAQLDIPDPYMDPTSTKVNVK